MGTAFKAILLTSLFLPSFNLANRDEEMTKLLVAYGADVSKSAQFSSCTDDHKLDVKQIPFRRKQKRSI